MHLGSGARRKEHLRIINGCKDAKELKAKLGMMRIWRVEISQDKDEDRVARDGYCGYSSMAQIINHTRKKYNLEVKEDRLEVAKAVKKLIDGAPGVIRKRCEKFRDNELSPKERAEMTYRMMMAERNHFLAYKGLDYEYWMRGMLIDGRCEEFKFSSWTKSHWDNERYMLLESRFNKRGDVLMNGEWIKVLEEDMIMHRGDHYHSRVGGLITDFEPR